MIISMIAAISENNVIGRNNSLPWHLPDDMKYFMQTTKEHYVIMGRRNYESLPEKFRPLPNRTNIIVTSQKKYKAPECVVVNSLDQAIKHALLNKQHEVFLIGGSRIYEDGLKLASKLYLTHIHAILEGDVHFPKVNWSEWKEVSRITHSKDDRHKHSFDFVIYERVGTVN